MEATLKEIRETLGYESREAFLKDWQVLSSEERVQLRRDVARELWQCFIH